MWQRQLGSSLHILTWQAEPEKPATVDHLTSLTAIEFPMPTPNLHSVPHASFLTRPIRMLIGGKWLDAISGETIPVENPATSEVVARVPAGDREDVDLAVRAARDTFDSGAWRKLEAAQRAEILWRLTDAILANIDEFARLETLDNGMPAKHAVHSIHAGVTTLRYYAGMCTKLYGQTSEISGNGREFHAFSLKEPIGVVGLITPWNGPFATLCNKAGPALASGCSVVLKPAEQTPLTALRFAEIAMECGIPEGAFNVVTGFGRSAGAALTHHPDVDAISFTGSTAVGKEIVGAAAGNLKRLSLELGGKSPVFVFDDANMVETIPAVAMGIFRNSGQVCFAGSRLYVQDRSYEQVLEGVADFARQLRVGDGTDPATELGPLISQAQTERVLSYVESGQAEGAELVTGGVKIGTKGYFVQPTVFANVDAKMKIAREEIFGPVLSVARFSSIEEATSLGNATRFGLGAGVYTQDVSKAHRLAKSLRAGNVWVNCYGFTDKRLPFGGYKESGWGREGGAEGIEAFLESKTVYVRL